MPFREALSALQATHCATFVGATAGWIVTSKSGFCCNGVFFVELLIMKEQFEGCRAISNKILVRAPTTVIWSWTQSGERGYVCRCGGGWGLSIALRPKPQQVLLHISLLPTLLSESSASTLP